MDKNVFISLILLFVHETQSLPGVRSNITKEERRKNFLLNIHEKGISNVVEVEIVHNKLNSLREKAKSRINTTQGIQYDSQKSKNLTRLQAEDKRVEKHADRIQHINEGIEEYFYQGDIKLTIKQADNLLQNIDTEDSLKRKKRQAFKDKDFPRTLWPKDQPISYYFHKSINNSTRKMIRHALQYWSNMTCLAFQENGTKNHHWLFYKGDGCWSYVGRLYEYKSQEISIGEGCDTFGTIIHEVGHALGFFHAHARYDRNEYIEVQHANIPRHWEDQFIKETKKTNDNYGIEYDYGSVMHYAMAFNIGDPPVMIAKDRTYHRTMGSDLGPSFDDLLMMNTHYSCLGVCSSSRTVCENSGFPHPRNCSTCICPTGFGGTNCSERAEPENGAYNCGETLDATEAYQNLSGRVGVQDDHIKFRMAACFWHIKAPQGKFIEIRMIRYSSYCCQGCVYGFTEIKAKNFTRTGSRYCCPSDIEAVPMHMSSTNLAIIAIYSKYNVEEFMIQYRYVDGNSSQIHLRTLIDRIG